MDAATKILIMLGGVFLIGLVTDLLGRHTPLPRVTLLLLAGFLIGPSVLNLLPAFSQAWFPVLTDIALVMIGFLLGQKMTLSAFRERGSTVFSISVGEVLATAVVMFIGLMALGVPVEVALLLSGVAPATDPVATADVVHEMEAQGSFTDVLLGIVAIDDAWGLLVFSILLATAQALSGDGAGVHVLLEGGWEVMGAVVVGAALGIPMAYLTGRIQPGEPTLAEALGLVLLCGGIAIWWQVSYILAAMVMGAFVATLASHHRRPFRAIEGIEWPFMILFFVLAGASLRADSLVEVGLIGAGYLVFRVIGLAVGAWIGARLAGSDDVTRRWMGFALTPQAGVALGMALLATQKFSDAREIVLPVVIASTVIFEVFGPLLTRRILVKAGQTGNR
jgi:Kef-type K+ transport system membrane component KefB